MPVAASAKMRMHTVKEGETLSSIAEQYGIDLETLQASNEQLGADVYKEQQLLILPGKGILHTVEVGDTLWRIAEVYGINMNLIIDANGKKNGQLSIGEKLFIPGAKQTVDSERQLARSDVSVSRGVSDRFGWPTVGVFTSGFGYRWGRIHSGIDIANDIGTPIKAARSGRIVHAGWYDGYGYAVIIEHDQGYTTLYGHLNEVIVQSGQSVKNGQTIAYMGSSGNSTGPHLHFEVWKNGTPFNPYNVLPQ